MIFEWKWLIGNWLRFLVFSGYRGGGIARAYVKGHVSKVMANLGGSNRVQVAIIVRDADLG
jgi:hypothetical protein